MEQPSFLPLCSGLNILFRLTSLHGFALAVTAGLEVPPFSLTVVALFYSNSLHTLSDPVIHLHLSQSYRSQVPQLHVGVQGFHCNFAADAILRKVHHTSLSWRYGKWNFSKSMCKNWCKAAYQSPFSCPCVLRFLSSLNYHGQNFMKVNIRILSECL